MIEKNETFGGTWLYKTNFCESTGFKQHYVDEGPRDLEVIVCLHGEPTCGYFSVFLTQSRSNPFEKYLSSIEEVTNAPGPSSNSTLSKASENSLTNEVFQRFPPAFIFKR